MSFLSKMGWCNSQGLRCQIDNYRPVSIVPSASNLFERPLFEQMLLFFDQIYLMYRADSEKVPIHIIAL